ncbi:biopolymer transporter ExbD [Chloracidobacterium aggregatum]|jgi:biopolymer transport protein TolR|uniref:Biopolymer transporter ExbD n=1 Tax=Chloracidobacterium sp. N TaxID=2821540 RepID=A0ABX8B042_9BACT|nr:biopolymer transporter ExbD [Chloracidobacterium aggregatum]QUV85698.1 biopolymer transporter ExbD [Chloracidobacterium sp. 2]QUV87898.1 biopolymer transporter ExbD [Chloracidobacterium sp. S]QUV90795.1 biopolymer transporter ExbD [Chloracidobacterium sp. A]QUV94010.1 biopolymer transporter ExbD [Chloracidobacterium sp. N]QUV97203.1 biopolymer transporter ExbD [Chloracidobacterium sp. E]
MGMSAGGGSGYNSDINVTPMVDVMLVLLIIFIVVTPLLSQGVNVNLPENDNPEEDPNITKDTSVVVSIPQTGQYYVGRDPVARTELVERIKRLMREKAKKEEQVVYIRAEKTVPYGEVVMTVDAIRNAGIDRIGLVTEKRKKK